MSPQAEDRHPLDPHGHEDSPPDFDLQFESNEFKLAPPDTTISDGASTANVGPSTLNDQQAPAEPIAGTLGSEHSDSKAKVLKYYFENFKRGQPSFWTCDALFKAQVGSFRTSTVKRKDVNHWTCPLGCSDFTSKQNFKLHIQSHLGIKDYECICGATFNAHSGLKRHQKKCRNISSISNVQI